MVEGWYKVRGILFTMWGHRWLGLAATLLVGAIGVGIAVTVPNRYLASARVYVDTQSILKPLMSGLAVQPNLDQQVQMMARTLISRPNVERVIRMADLDLRTRSSSEREATVDDLIKDIKLSSTGNNLYTIEYRHTNPTVARNVVQSLLSLFVEGNLGDKRRDAEQAQKFIEQQIVVYEKRLAEAEAALKDFKLRHLAVMPNLAQDYVARAGDAQRGLILARQELRQAEYARDAIRKQLSTEKPTLTSEELLSVTATQRRPTDLEQRLAAARQRLDGLRSSMTEAHPDVIGTRRLVAQLEQQLEVERKAAAERPEPIAPTTAPRSIPNKLYQDLRISLSEAEARVASMRAKVADAQAQLTEAREMAQAIPKVEAEFTQLNRDYEVNKKNYEQLVTRRASAQISGSMDSATGVGEFRIVDPPRVEQRPVSPNRVLILSAALAASLAAGLAACVVLARLRPVLFDARTLRELSGVPVFGTVTRITQTATVRRARLGLAAFAGVTTLYVGCFGAVLLYVSRNPWPF